ncbi:MAG: radical SAM protein [Lachnospiraceae bacterium]|nr:radical SAM protein [Lachnospiraceae bacterium]
MNVILKVTTMCNLACAYCSEGDKSPITMSDELYKKLINQLPELLDKNNDKTIDIIFHGGEPTVIGVEKLSFFLEYAKNILSNYELSFSMQTNGYCIDQELIELLRKYDVGVGVSLDGYTELHDENRRSKTGEVTCKKILHNIKVLNESGVSCSTLMVVNTSKKIDADKLLSFLVENNLSVKINPLIPCGRAAVRKDCANVMNNYNDLLKELIFKTMVNSYEIEIEPLSGLIHSILYAQPLNECSYNGSCGKSFICVYPDGGVSFCGRTTDIMLYGNLQNKSLIELYESSSAQMVRERFEYLKMNDCKNCKEWDYCHGGCTFEALNAYGNINTQFPNCELRRDLLHFLRTEGLALIKKRLVNDKKRFRERLYEKQEILKSL